MKSLCTASLAFACALLIGPETAAAQQAAAPGAAFEGRYTYAAGPGDPIGDAIERGIRDMSFVTRPIARRRLRNTNQPYRTIEVALVDGTVATRYDGRPAIVSPADGAAAPWMRDGEPLTVTTRFEAGALVQTFTAEDGVRENVYTLTPDGRRLILSVTLTSPRLPAPIRYQLAYERAR